MNIVHVSGSRNRDGSTARMAKTLLEAAAEAGALVEEMYLPEHSIERCRQCDANGWGICRKQDDGSCAIDDDFAALFDRLKAADALVVSTPVYYGSLSESLRAFTDRLRRVAAGREFVRGKPVVMIAVAGGGGGGAPNCIRDMERVLENCGLSFADAFPVRRQNMTVKQSQLACAGTSLARGEYEA